MENGCWVSNLYMSFNRIFVFKGGPHRNRRDLYTGDCIFPSEMRTAELKCHIYSKYV